MYVIYLGWDSFLRVVDVRTRQSLPQHVYTDKETGYPMFFSNRRDQETYLNENFKEEFISSNHLFPEEVDWEQFLKE